MIEKISQEYDG